MSRMEHLKLYLRCEVIKYLDNSGLLDLLQHSTEEYRRKQNYGKRPHPNFYLPIHLDLLKLFDENCFLCDFIIKEPIKMKKIIQDVVYLSIQSTSCDDIQIGQIHSPLHVFNMPYCVEEMRYMTGMNQNRMKFMRGVLAALGPPQEYIRQSAWKCLEECDHPTVILSRIPLNAPWCHICKSPTFEFQASRDYGEMVKATFIPTEAINIKYNGYEVGKELIIFDKMLNVLELGQEYLVAVITKSGKQECWGIEPILPPLTKLIHLPPNLRQIYYQDRHPWTLLFEMCWSLNDGITLSDAFIHLSMGLLLSIATIQPGESPVSVLALGSDTSIAASLMKEASSLARRSQFVNASNLYSGEWKKEDEGCDANGIVLSGSGVAVLGNWTVQSANQKNVFMIKSIIESNKIKITSEKTVPLKSSLWTYWDVTSSTKDQHQLTTLINLFGISFQADCQQVDSLADYILINSIEPNAEKKKFTVSKKDMKDIYEFISNWPVSGDAEAETLLKDYFRTVRKDRSERVPLQTLMKLNSLAKASARLNLRSRVIREDVLFVIYLHQHSQLVLFGDTGLRTPELKNVKHVNEIPDIADDFDKWLQSYIFALIGETSITQCSMEN